ncbi:hypothetical protein TNCV_3732201 [Trichonephila clavipes]|nr:hypothetical protein TNCV_3732201 [Trichonephila clavipes]
MDSLEHDERAGRPRAVITDQMITVEIRDMKREPIIPQLKKIRQKRRISFFHKPCPRTVTSNCSTECRSKNKYTLFTIIASICYRPRYDPKLVVGTGLSPSATENPSKGVVEESRCTLHLSRLHVITLEVCVLLSDVPLFMEWPSQPFLKTDGLALRGRFSQHRTPSQQSTKWYRASIGVDISTDKFDDDIQKVTPARAHLAFSLLSNSALMSKSFCFDLLRLRAKTAWLWLPQSASLTVRCPQRYVHRVKGESETQKKRRNRQGLYDK